MKIFALVTDAFGGRGGIAKFNRDLLTALCESPEVEKVIAWPRVSAEKIDELPSKLTYRVGGLNSKVKYIFAVLSDIFKDGKSDYLICGHIHLLPIAHLIKIMGRCEQVVLVVHGIEAWKPHDFLIQYLVKKIDLLISVSHFTIKKMLGWVNIEKIKYVILPNTIDLDRFTPGEKNNKILKKHDLADKKVILTLGRLAGKERSKGFDEILEIMPALLKEDSSIRYIIAGDGSDRKRLESKACELGVKEAVIFAGYIDENLKKDFYRIADIFAMPGRGEGFGIVYLEALACGTPVIGSKADGSREALMDGKLGCLVDPENLDELKAAINNKLQKAERKVPELLDFYSFENYKKRVFEIFTSQN